MDFNLQKIIVLLGWIVFIIGYGIMLYLCIFDE